MIDLLGLIKNAFVVVVAAISVLNPFNSPPSSIPIPTPTIIEQPSPTPKEVPVQKNTYVDPDPVINCISSHPNCMGQSIRAKQSECKNIWCCSLPDKTVLLHDKSQCVSTPSQNNQPNQLNQSNQSSNTSLVTCPDGYGNNVVESKDACDKRWEKIKIDGENARKAFNDNIDPIITCQSKGEDLVIKKSLCNSLVDCQIGSEYFLLYPNNCTELQAQHLRETSENRAPDNSYNQQQNEQCKNNAAREYSEKRQGAIVQYGNDSIDSITRNILTPEYQRAKDSCDRQYPL